MSYININTLEKVEAFDIKLAHPDVSFPNRGWTDEELAPYGYAELHYPSEHPFSSPYEKLVEGVPVKIDDKWYIQFDLVSLTTEESAVVTENQWSSIRSDRTTRLSDCDWTQLNDSPLSNTERNLWADYRQALRDITDHPDPFNITWPTSPSDQGGV